MRYIKSYVANLLLKHLFCAVIPTDGITLQSFDPRNKSGVLRRGKETLPKDETEMLASESRTILRSRAFNEVCNSMRRESEKTMFERSKNSDDMLFGKAMLYTIDMLKQKFEQIAKIER